MNLSKIELLKGDCLELMKTIESGSVDAIITDPPYGTTACKWDSVIDFELMWEQLNRVIKPNGAIVLFGSEPSSLIAKISGGVMDSFPSQKGQCSLAVSSFSSTP